MPEVGLDSCLHPCCVFQPLLVERLRRVSAWQLTRLALWPIGLPDLTIYADMFGCAAIGLHLGLEVWLTIFYSTFLWLQVWPSY